MSSISIMLYCYFNPRSLAGATRNDIRRNVLDSHFNPRSLTGTTYKPSAKLSSAIYFNPRSLTGATRIGRSTGEFSKISIHAPLRERLRATLQSAFYQNFNPRSLAGATCSLTSAGLPPPAFQSTLPHGSDGKGAPKTQDAMISIHAPSRERQD